MSGCSFRRATAADLDSIHEFYRGLIDCAPPSREALGTLLEDPAADVAVTECGGAIIALGQMAIVGSREGWIVGQKAQLGPRQHALLQSLMEYQTERARRLELRVVRAGWMSSNAGAQRAYSRFGYHRVASYGLYSSESLGSGAPVLSVLTERDYSGLQNWLGRSSLLRAGAGLFFLGGSWMELTARHMRGLLTEGQVLGLRGPSGAAESFAIAAGRGELAPAAVDLGYLDGDWQGLERLAMALRGLAARTGPGRVRVFLVDDPAVRGAFQGAGFQDDWDGRELCIWERYL